MVDSGSGEIPLHVAAQALGRRVAAAAGALVALLALLRHAPVAVACLRGGIAFAAVLAVARLGAFAVERSVAADRRRARRTAAAPMSTAPSRQGRAPEARR